MIFIWSCLFIWNVIEAFTGLVVDNSVLFFNVTVGVSRIADVLNINGNTRAHLSEKKVHGSTGFNLVSLPFLESCLPSKKDSSAIDI